MNNDTQLVMVVIILVVGITCVASKEGQQLLWRFFATLGLVFTIVALPLFVGALLMLVIRALL